MSVILSWWKNLSISKKLYLVVGVMAVLIGGELLTLRFAMHTLSAVRAFVAGEGLWSKAQKNALYQLQGYALTHNEGDYEAFLADLHIPAGDHRARLALENPVLDREEVRKGFLAGGIHPDDIDPMIDLLRRFYWISYLDRALTVWGEADAGLAELQQAASDYHEALRNPGPGKARATEIASRISGLNEKLTRLEGDFSDALGEGSRWLEHVVISLLFLAVLMVESIGLTLTFLTSRQISRGLANLIEFVGRIGRGDFQHPLEVQSRDEIGQLQLAVNDMGSLLQKTYGKLEARVQDRTAELKKAKDQLEVIIGGVADGILVQNSAFRCVYANEAGAKLCGFDSADEFIHSSVEEVIKRFQILDEAGAPFPTERLPARLALQGHLDPPEVLLQARTLPGGQETWSKVRARPILDDNGRPYLAVSIFRDVTAERKAQQAQQLINEVTKTLAESLDYEATLRSTASMAVKVMGGWCTIDLLEEDGTIRQVAVEHTDPAKVQLAIDLRAKYPSDPKSPLGSTKIIRTGQATLVPHISESALAAALQDPEKLRIFRELGLKSYIGVPLSIGDKTFGAISFISTSRSYGAHDFELATELGKRAAIAVMNSKLYKESQEAVSVREEYLSIASHELRTPLTSLLLQLQLITRHAKAPQGEKSLQTVAQMATLSVQQVGRLTALLDELMDLTRIRRGKIELKLERCDLARLASDIVTQFGREAASRGSTISLDAPAPAFGRFDSTRIGQVLTNLISNAIKYGEASPIVVSVSRNQGQVLLAVKDSGPGIPPDRQDKVFDQFERGVAGAKAPGLGLGLFISRQLVEAHPGGKLTLQSKPGSGATFEVALGAG